MKYKTWLCSWLDDYVKINVKERTYLRYKQIITLYIIPHLGNMDMNCISPSALQSHVSFLLKRENAKYGSGLSASTVNAVISVIQNSLRTAYSLGLSDAYNGNLIKRPRCDERAVSCFTLSEQKKIETFVLSCKNDKLFGVVLCLYTGLRIGELLALKWKDIDFANGLLSVVRSCYDGKNGVVFDTPKTQCSRRVIPLPKQIIPLLKALKKRGNSEYILHNTHGDALYVRSYQRTFSLLLKKLEIPHRGFHSLRHTFATRAIECGMDVRTLSEILGHKNPTITLNRYAHSLLEHKTAMMNRLGKLL